GMDVLDVKEKFTVAIDLARETNSPTFIEAKTYRYRGHSMSDPALYRTAEEVDQYKHQDPILMLVLVDFLGCAVESRIGHGVAAVAVGLGFDESGGVCFAGEIYGDCEFFFYVQYVHS